MATNYTSLLGFALPTTGELDGTWGTTVNNSITELVEDSIAATATASVASGNWTLSTTGSGATNEARCAILIPTGSPGVSRNIIAPSQSKAYIVINQSDAAVVLKGSATTGATISAGAKAVVAWNGSDFTTIATSASSGVSTISFGSTGLTPSTATSGAVSVAGTLAATNGGTGQTTYSDGQLLIGNSATGGLAKSTITAGAGISISNGNGTITITSSGATSEFPSGTIMLFGQTAAPTGWTKSTTHNDKALRVVSGAASSGGSVAFTTAFNASRAVTVTGTNTSTTATGTVSLSGGSVGSTTLTTSQIPAHTHGTTTYASVNESAGYGLTNSSPGFTDRAIIGVAGDGRTSTSTGGGTSHNHTLSNPTASFSGTSHTHTFSGSGSVNLAVQYVDVILATKD